MGNNSNHLYHNINIHLDPRVWRQVKKVAATEGSTMIELVSEAILTYIKWLRKAEKDENKRQEYEAAVALLTEIEKEKLYKKVGRPGVKRPGRPKKK